jgi:CRISPR/Cas system-associated exonuclease Cas4 (RecB family)
MSWVIREQAPEIAEAVKKMMLRRIEDREPPNRIWLSDTVYCGRKKIYAMLGYEGDRMTEQALNRLWLGLMIHAELEKIGVAREVAVEYNGIRGRVDCLADTGEPIEIKAASSIWVTGSRYAETHVQQLSRYCLALNRETGILFYYVPGVKITSLPAYRYRFNLEAVKRETDERIRLLRMAEEARDPFILPPTWHSSSFDNWECRACPYISLCRHGSLNTL